MSAKIKFYGYKKCGTCIKAEKYLRNANIEFEFIDITQHPPAAEELAEFSENADVSLNKLFNTSGLQYRELNIKEKLPSLTNQEILDLLASNGRLIKRPLITDGKRVSIGFREEQFEKVWGK
ncbi:MAG: arsenate reductase family protein [Nitrosomonas sp.]|nr:arsenate reductase family protein [Nitrosomonas sp.]